MDWKNLGSQLFKKGLPLLGGLLGGPAGALGANAAVSLISSALGLKEEEATPDKVFELIQADPKALAELQKAEMAHKERLQELLLEERKLEVQDIANARAREMAVVEATGKKDYNLYILAWTVIAGFFTLCGLLMKVVIPDASSEVIFILFGALAAGFTQVIAYFFGSSRSSVEKTKLLSVKERN